MNIRKTNTTGYPYIYRKDGKYIISFQLEGSPIYGGLYRTKRQARLALYEILKEWYGETHEILQFYRYMS